MKIAAATDFAGSTGDPDMSLRALSEGGFRSLHWCHHWCDDFLYGKHEIAYIKSLLKKYDLELLDIHGSHGAEKAWCALDEYQRKEGVELVKNRIEMLRELDGRGTIMMHIPFYKENEPPERRALIDRHMEALYRSLDELIPHLEKNGTMIAVENMWAETWEGIERIMERYPEKYLGICYDSGHANASAGERMALLEKNKMRLQALHLHDNDGNGDLHQPPFYGTINWERLAKIIATSSYTREVSFEMAINNTPFFVTDPDGKRISQPYEARLAFAKDAFERCSRFAKMVEELRK